MADKNKDIAGANTRLENLKRTMLNIEKKIGTGSVRFMGDKSSMNIERLPTGIVSIDNILGGGLPKGRIVEIYGPESSGKCIIADTWVLTPNGYRTVTEIFEDCNLQTEAKEDIVLMTYPLINMDGEVEETSHFTFNGIRQVYEVCVETGSFVTGTANHPLKTTLNSVESWTKISDLKVGDELVCLAEDGMKPFTSKVVSIIDAGMQETFDFVMPKTHSFIANDIVNHNTTLTLHVIAETQAKGGVVAFIDAEHALDPVYAAALGVKVDDLVISQPDNGEDALEITEQLVSSGSVDLIIVDSVAALVPKAELEGEMGDSHMGLQARLMSQALRKITGSAGKMGATIVFINQLRDKIGNSYGSNETTTGGKALKFYASIRIDIRKIQQIKEKDVVVGATTKVKCVKNKTASPFKETLVEVRFGQGISRTHSIIDLAIAKGLIEKGGAWYTIGDRRCQGKEAVATFLKENPEELAKIEEACRDNGDTQASPVSIDTDESDD